MLGLGVEAPTCESLKVKSILHQTTGPIARLGQDWRETLTRGLLSLAFDIGKTPKPLWIQPEEDSLAEGRVYLSLPISYSPDDSYVTGTMVQEKLCSYGD